MRRSGEIVRQHAVKAMSLNEIYCGFTNNIFHLKVDRRPA